MSHDSAHCCASNRRCLVHRTRWYNYEPRFGTLPRIEAWLPQVYAVKVPHRADEAREAAAAHLADDEKRPQIIESVKAMFWRSTARTFVEEAEAD